MMIENSYSIQKRKKDEWQFSFSIWSAKFVLIFQVIREGFNLVFFFVKQTCYGFLTE